MTVTSEPGEDLRDKPATAVERLTEFTGPDLHDLCDAAEAAIRQGGGFGWLSPPPREVMEAYWKGVLLVPERELFVARLDRTVAGSAQLVRPARNNEAQAFVGHLTTAFMAPWARGHGLARMLVEAIEAAARRAGLRVLNLDVRATQEVAIRLYESLGYRRWGTHPHYAWIDGAWVTGYYYYKDLFETDASSGDGNSGEGGSSGP
ncbi:MAG: GNAT family N-acetyltransferase [Alphaproteobacteria bacterium]|nr:MAG: GNAT family N-acetyltransferase [Alphaproteobacteria bacterium]